MTLCKRCNGNGKLYKVSKDIMDAYKGHRVSNMFLAALGEPVECPECKGTGNELADNETSGT